MRVLDGPDLYHLAQEGPDRPMHTLKVAILDRALDPAEVRRWAATSLTSLAPLRNRLARAPLARPVWVDGGPPDLGYHLQHRHVAAPGDEAALTDALAEHCSELLERSRPLWRLWHLRGLEGDRDALVFQIHHVVADGGASVALLEAMADQATGAPCAAPPEPAPAGPRPTPGRLLRSALATGALEVARLPSQIGRFGAYLRHARTAPRSGATPVTKAFLGPATRYNGSPERRRAYAFATTELSRLRALRAATGASLNDVYLTLVGGALRAHLDALGEPPDAALTATVPAALPERRDTFGNSVTTLYVSLHSDVVDPMERLEAVRRSVAASRAATDRDVRLLPDWQRFPRLNHGIVRVMEAVERRGGRPAYNVIVTNVRGPAPFSLAGCPVTELRSVGPLSGHLGLNVTAWSYGDRFTVGLHCYAGSGDHLAGFGQHLEAELAAAERRAGTVAGPVRRPEPHPAPA